MASGLVQPPRDRQPVDPLEAADRELHHAPDGDAKGRALPARHSDERYKHVDDYAACLQLSTFGDLHILPEKLLLYRFHGQSVSHLNEAAQVKSGMAALSDRLKVCYGVAFEVISRALWSAPQNAVGLHRPADFYRLLRWINPLLAEFRDDRRGGARWCAFGDCHGRLLPLLMSHWRRFELSLRVLPAMLVSPFPMGR